MPPRHLRSSLLLAVGLLLAPTLSPLGAQDTHLLVIAGLGGEPRYQEEFVQWGGRMVEAALASGVAAERITFLAEDPARSPERISNRSTRENIEAAFQSILARSTPNDRVLVVLIGHGAGSGADSRVSIPGPSLNASHYALLLESLSPRSVGFVNLASASGDFIPILAGEDRVVVTATRSSQQRNAALFGGYFVTAFAEGGSDLDRDGRTSLLEAFEFARQETERYYRDRGLIASEQALLEDRPTGRGVTLPMEEAEVGLVAGRFTLAGAGPAIQIDDPALLARLRELYQAQESIEDQIAALNQRASTLDPTELQALLQPLLIELARLGQQIRQLEAGP